MKKPITLRKCLAWFWDKTMPLWVVLAFFAYVAVASTEWF